MLCKKEIKESSASQHSTHASRLTSEYHTRHAPSSSIFLEPPSISIANVTCAMKRRTSTCQTRYNQHYKPLLRLNIRVLPRWTACSVRECACGWEDRRRSLGLWRWAAGTTCCGRDFAIQNARHLWKAQQITHLHLIHMSHVTLMHLMHTSYITIMQRQQHTLPSPTASPS